MRLLDRPVRQAPFDIGPVLIDGGSESVAELETACRPHQAPGQTAPMQAYNRNFDQSVPAA